MTLSAAEVAQQRDLIFRACALLGNAHKALTGALGHTEVLELAACELRGVLNPAQLLMTVAAIAEGALALLAGDVPFEDALQRHQADLLAANRRGR